jgi:hypothetical protein
MLEPDPNDEQVDKTAHHSHDHRGSPNAPNTIDIGGKNNGVGRLEASTHEAGIAVTVVEHTTELEETSEEDDEGVDDRQYVTYVARDESNPCIPPFEAVVDRSFCVEIRGTGGEHHEPPYHRRKSAINDIRQCSTAET